MNDDAPNMSDTPISAQMREKYRRDAEAMRERKRLKEEKQKAQSAEDANDTPSVTPVRAVMPVRGFKGGDPVAIGKLGGRPRGSKNREKTNPLESLAPKKQKYALYRAKGKSRREQRYCLAIQFIRQIKPQ
jgi:hypothetical protein